MRREAGVAVYVEVVDPARTRALRRAVLRPHFGPDDALPGDDIPEAVHIGALGTMWDVVGTCFVYPATCPWPVPAPAPHWRLRSMATAPDQRGRGIGAAVLRGAEDYVIGAGGTVLWCHARETAAGFYAAHGWQIEGGQFVENDLPHRAMWIALTNGRSAAEGNSPGGPSRHSG
jgi:GNAT superfamily N-acetyltransferase